MLKTLIRLRLREMFSSTKRRNGGLGEAGMIILLFIAGIALIFLFSTIAFTLLMGLSAIGYDWLYFAMIFILMFMLSFIGTVFMTKQQLFEAKDNQTLLAMPINPRDIIVSRLLSIGIMDYVMVLLVAVPSGIIYIIFRGFNIVGAISYILGVILIPLLTLAFSVLFGWLIAMISSKTRYKNALNMIISTIFLMIYFYFCFSWQSRIEELVEHGAEIGNILSKYIPPVYHFGLACAEGRGLSLLIFSAFCIIPFIIAIVLVSRNFVKIITTERGNVRIEYKGGRMNTASVFKALSNLEMKRFTSSTTYMLNAGMGLMFMILLAGFILLKRSDFTEVINVISGTASYNAPVLIIILLFMCGMTVISAGTISLDAKTLWLFKSLPLDCNKVLLAKTHPHIIISLPAVILSSILLEFTVPMTVIGRIMLLILPVAASIFNAFLGVAINLIFPKFNWNNEAQAIKQGASPMLSMLFSTMPVLIMIAVVVMDGIFKFAPVDAVLVIILMLYIIGILLLSRWLKTGGVRRFNGLQNGF